MSIDTVFSETQIRWILELVPGAQERAENGELLFGTIDTWSTWKLSGGAILDSEDSHATRTMLLHIQQLDWDDEILRIRLIPQTMLPEVRRHTEIYGDAAAVLFFGSTVPIAGMVGELTAALFGQLEFEPGMVQNTYGTGAFIDLNTGDKHTLSKLNLSTKFGVGLNGQNSYALEGSVFVAGSAITWLRDAMKLIERYSDSEAAARATQSTNEVVVVPAFTGLGAPYWDSDARGEFFGITRGNTREDYLQDTLTSLAYTSRDVVDTMKQDTGMPIPALRVDGGAEYNDYHLQLLADILGIPIERAAHLETTAMGAAFFAGSDTGFWNSTDEHSSIVQVGKRFEPTMDVTDRETLYEGWKTAVAATTQ